MTYQPNFQDPRVQKKVKRAIGWAQACLSETKSRTWSTRELNLQLGQPNKDLGRYLRNHLLICTDEHYCEGKSKSYLLNLRGRDRLREQLELHNTNIITSIPLCITSQESLEDLAINWTKQEFQRELSTRVFTYKHASNRNWHPLQRVKREIKRVVFRDSGLKYQYDIECCAPRLLLQHSQQIPEILDQERQVGPKNNKRPLWLQGPMDLWLDHIQQYLANRTEIRNALAQRLEIDLETAKQIITALFAGARIALNTDSSIYQMLSGDPARIHALKQDPYVSGLVEEIKIMWLYITPTMSRRTSNKTGRLVPISSREKWHRYFQLEYQVLSAITDYLKSTDNEFFTEHDGWSCANEVDQNLLRNYVSERTGFDIKLDLEVL